MAVLDILKGKSTIQELMQLPNRIFHELYHRHYLIATKQDKEGAKKIEGEEMMEQMEDIALLGKGI